MKAPCAVDRTIVTTGQEDSAMFKRTLIVGVAAAALLGVFGVGCGSAPEVTSGTQKELLATVDASPRTMALTPITKWKVTRDKDGSYTILGIGVSNEVDFELLLNRPEIPRRDLPALQIWRLEPYFGHASLNYNGRVTTNSFRGRDKLIDAMNRDLKDVLKGVTGLAAQSRCDASAIAAGSACAGLLAGEGFESGQDCLVRLKRSNTICDVENLLPLGPTQGGRREVRPETPPRRITLIPPSMRFGK